MEKKWSKIFAIIKDVVSWTTLVFAFIITAITIVLIGSSSQNGYEIFGNRFYIVQTDSMSATDFDAGDLIICKKIAVNELKEGDIITFVSKSVRSYGQTVTHKIRKITQDVNGNIAFVTYGTTTGKDDEALATEILGRYAGKIKGAGKFIIFSKTPLGYVLLIFLPFSILIIIQAINCMKLLKEGEKTKKS